MVVVFENAINGKLGKSYIAHVQLHAILISSETVQEGNVISIHFQLLLQIASKNAGDPRVYSEQHNVEGILT